MATAATYPCCPRNPAGTNSRHLRGGEIRTPRVPVGGGVFSTALQLVATAAVLAAVPLTALAQEREAANELFVGVFGIVAERGTDNPIEGAAVQLIPESDAEALLRLTDAFGRFSIPRLLAGRYRLRVERLGYEMMEEAIQLGADSDVRVELVVEAIEMEPLLVVTNRQLRPDIPGWDNRRRLDLGTFITREEIERPGITRATDVLRRVPSIQVIPKRGGGVYGNDVLMRGCSPTLFVDGAPIAGSGGGFALDELFGPEGIEAMEVYTAANVPPDFGFGGPCGAVIVWTRRSQRGGPDGSQRSSWKWFGIAAGVFGVLLLLTR